MQHLDGHFTSSVSPRQRSRIHRLFSIAAATSLLAACATTEEPKPAPAPEPVVVTLPPVPPKPAPAPPAPTPVPEPLPVEMPIAPKETAPPVELPAYARKGRRLPPDGGDPGKVVMSYCRSFEIERDAASYYKRLERNRQLPSDATIAARSADAGQTLSAKQVVEREWAIQRENAKSSPQRCKVLGGSVDAGVAIILVEADIYGKRQRGTATVVPVNGKWRVRDHGSWEPIK